MNSARSPTSLRSSATRSSRSPLLPTPLTTRGSPTMSRSVILGLRDENGSWKIICISRRSPLSCERGSVATLTTSPSSERKLISPSVGSTTLRMHREVVVFPHPLSPTSPRVSPSLMLKVTSSTRAYIADLPLQEPFFYGEVLAEAVDLEQRRLGALAVGGLGRRLGQVSSSVIEKAADVVIRFDLAHHRLALVADTLHIGRTARMEEAPGRTVIGVRH